MFPNAVILEIRSLLDEGELSHRAIAEMVGVSRGVVDNIADGRRGLRYHKDDRVRQSHDQIQRIPRRCRCCGGLVFEPCLLCRTRSYQQRIQEIRRHAVRSQMAVPTPRRVA
jgi:hypothetical protein